jgi:hypothetical protein
MEVKLHLISNRNFESFLKVKYNNGKKCGFVQVIMRKNISNNKTVLSVKEKLFLRLLKAKMIRNYIFFRIRNNILLNVVLT